MLRRKRFFKYVRRVNILWNAFARYHKEIGAKYVVLDTEGTRLLQKCIDLQRGFVRYYPHPENVGLLKAFERVMYPPQPAAERRQAATH